MIKFLWFAAAVLWAVVVLGILADRDPLTLGLRIFVAVAWTLAALNAMRRRRKARRMLGGGSR